MNYDDITDIFDTLQNNCSDKILYRLFELLGVYVKHSPETDRDEFLRCLEILNGGSETRGYRDRIFRIPESMIDYLLDDNKGDGDNENGK